MSEGDEDYCYISTLVQFKYWFVPNYHMYTTTDNFVDTQYIPWLSRVIVKPKFTSYFDGGFRVYLH